jgi:uncharacterized protein (TIGR00290 family)
MTSSRNAPVNGSPAALSWSGGKDATMSLRTLEAQGRHVAALLSTFGADGRSSGHGVRRELLEAQAHALGIPLATVQFPDPCPNDAYEAAIAAALERPPLAGLGEMAFGDLFLEDHRDYRTQQLAKTGWTASFPIWRLDTDALAREIIDSGIRALIVAVDLNVLDESYLGRAFDQALLDDLPEGADPCAEVGEFHTFVTHNPRFSHPIPVRTGEVTRRATLAFMDLLPA